MSWYLYNREFNVQQGAIANAEYEHEKKLARLAGKPHSVTHQKISKRHGKHPNWLKFWRTNHLSASRIARRTK